MAEGTILPKGKELLLDALKHIHVSVAIKLHPREADRHTSRNAGRETNRNYKPNSRFS
jgi:hypothetical protein